MCKRIALAKQVLKTGSYIYNIYIICCNIIFTHTELLFTVVILCQTPLKEKMYSVKSGSNIIYSLWEEHADMTFGINIYKHN